MQARHARNGVFRSLIRSGQPRSVRGTCGAVRATLAIALPLLVLCRNALGQEPDGLATARLLEAALVDAIARAEGAVVAVARVDDSRPARTPNPFDPFGLGAPNAPAILDSSSHVPEQFGAGVIVQHPQRPDERYVLTTYHVAFGSARASAERAMQVYVRLANREMLPAQAVPHAADRRIDLAVLRLQLAEAQIAPEDVLALPLGQADDIRKGRLVIALGNPYAMARDGSASASIGIVSNLARRPQLRGRETPPGENSTIHEYGTLLTVDTRLQVGTSGGALLNLDGELIGITTALAALQGYEKSAGYAIPFDEGTRRIIGQLLNGYEAEYGFLGISPEPVRLTSGPQRFGVRAAHVALDSPAAQAGLTTGDVILQINGRPVFDVADLMRIIGLLGPGAEARLLVHRGGGARPVAALARLGKWPVYDDSEILSTRPRYSPWRGLIVDYPTARQRFLASDRLEQYRRAVVVMRVIEDSAAAAAGLRSGDYIARVDGTPVQSPDEFEAAVANRDGPVVLTLWEGREVRLE